MSVLTFADIDEQCARFKELRRDDIKKLQDWYKNQPHLPTLFHPIESALFLHKTRYSIEAAKQRIDLYYTFRTKFPEFFSNRHPSEPRVKRALDTSLISVLPNTTPEGFMVIYIRFLDRNPDVFCYNEFFKIIDMTIELEHKQRGCYAGHIGIIDLEGLTLSHILKINVNYLKKFLVYMQKMMPIRLKSIHFVNSVPFVDKLIAVMQPFLKKDYPIRVHFGNNATIFKFVPEDILPIECGGSKLCAADYYQNIARKNMEINSEYFKMEEKKMVDESKRLNKLANFDDTLGIDGTFKKLDVD